VRAAALALAILGVGLGLRSGLLLLGRGRPQRGPRPAFVVAGPYRYLRNPLFAGLVLTLAGTALAARSGWIAAVATIVAGALHAWVVRREEPRLLAHFGLAYEEYLRRVPRWLPRRPADT
jgi:protein-S-isoprenylcysteine O-methyltransferase Ste14